LLKHNEIETVIQRNAKQIDGREGAGSYVFIKLAWLLSAYSAVVSPHVISIVGHLSFNSSRMNMKKFLSDYLMNFHIIIGLCFVASSFLISACSPADSAAQTSNQNSNASNQNANVPSMVKVGRPNPNLNGRVYTSKTFILNTEILKNLDCNNQNRYNLVEVENYHEEESITSRDLNIVVDNEDVVKIELPTGLQVKNFRLNSTKKTKNGFQMKTEWGGGSYHYEIQFDFKCKENNFYLYKVKKDSFSTTNPDNGNYWDKKETEETKIEPNLPIEKFLISDYL
jgi:hypothetical protein